MAEFVTVAKVGSIQPGRGKTIAVGDRVVAIFNDGGTYWAIDDMCPHAGASLGAGDVVDGVVACPLHAWRFRVSDGTWCDNPRLKVDAFEVRVQGDDIQVKI